VIYPFWYPIWRGSGGGVEQVHTHYVVVVVVCKHALPYVLVVVVVQYYTLPVQYGVTTYP
jgi:hypothetical protein